MNVCVVSKDKKGKMQDNEDKETSTDEIQSTREYKKENSRRRHGWLSILRGVLSPAQRSPTDCRVSLCVI